MGPTAGIWPGKTAQSLAEILTASPDILFLGDSLTDQWSAAGHAAWERHFGDMRIAEFGIGGDTTSNLLHRLSDPALKRIAPRIVMILIGTNNAFAHDAADIVAGIGAVAESARRCFAEAAVFVQTLPPLGPTSDHPLRRKVDEINALLRRKPLPGGARLVDTHHLFFGLLHQLLPGMLAEDNIHLLPGAYEKLGAFLAGVIRHALAGREEPCVMVSGENYLHEPVEGSDRLAVFLNARGGARGSFMNYRNANALGCSKLFLLSDVEDFYQRHFDNIAELVRRLCAEHGYRRVVYIGISAGAYAGLVLGQCCPNTERVVAFNPQFQLDQPITLGWRKIEPDPLGRRFDPRFVDIRETLNNTAVPTDIILGCYDTSDGIIIRDAEDIDNPAVTKLYVRWSHGVIGLFDQKNLLLPIFHQIRDGAPLSIPPEYVASPLDVLLAIKGYELMYNLHGTTGRVSMPDIDDSNSRNGPWFHAKARALTRNGDHAYALAEAFKSCLYTCGGRGEDYLCAGHIAHHIGRDDLAIFFYRQAQQREEKEPVLLALARSYHRTKDQAGLESCVQDGIRIGMKREDFRQFLPTAAE